MASFLYITNLSPYFPQHVQGTVIDNSWQATNRNKIMLLLTVFFYFTYNMLSRVSTDTDTE